MKLQPSDFVTPKAPALEVSDFQGAIPRSVNISGRSASQVAGTQALLVNTDPSSYEETKSMLLDPRSRADFITQQVQIRDAMFDDALDGLLDMVGNPETTPEERFSLSVGAGAGPVVPDSKSTPNLDLLAEETLIADSEGESEAAAQGRYNFVDEIRGVNEQKVRISNAINALRLGEDASLASKALDLAELFAPLVEWNNTDQLLRQAQREQGLDSDGSILMGSQKERMGELIKEIPLDKREEFAHAMIELVQESSQVLFPDGNNIAALDNLERMLLDGDYSDGERWFDNATALLDVIGVGALARAAVKTAKVGNNANRAARGVDGEILNPAPANTGPNNLQLESPAIDGEYTDTTGQRRIGKQGTEVGGLRGEVVETGTEIVPRDVYSEVEAPYIDGEYTDVTRDPNAQVQGDTSPLAVTDQTPPKPTGTNVTVGANREFTMPATEVQRVARAQATRTDVGPASPSQVIKDTNPDTARKMHQAVREDKTGRAADAFYNTNADEAIANDILPEPDVRRGRIPNKVEMPASPEPENIRKARLTTGNTVLSRAEEARVVDRFVDTLKDIGSLRLQKESLLIRLNDDNTTNVRALYHPLDSGFNSPEAAKNHAEVAFRLTGVKPEDINVVAKVGAEWVPVKEGAKLKEGTQYAVSLDTNYAVRAEDIDEVDMLTTGNWLTRKLDRAEGQWGSKFSQGSLVQHLFDAASVIHPQIVNAASVAVDRSFAMKKMYVDAFEDFTSQYASLGKERRAKMSDYIHQANFEGIPFSVTNLASRGFNSAEIKALETWRKANDAMWHATNHDLVKNLRSRGFASVVHKDSDTKFVGQPVKRNAVGGRSVAYDPVSGKVIDTKPDVIDELYENGGEVIRLQQPSEIDGQWVDLVVSNNTTTGSYTRALYDGEVVLAYRDGYYPVMYDAPYFIEREVRLKDGTTINKVVGTAKDSREAEVALAALRAKDSSIKYLPPRLNRNLGRNQGEVHNESWATATNSGLSTQRVRGKRLEDLGNLSHREDRTNLKDPLEAVADQIHRLSNTVAMRDYLSVVRKRWMLNYGKYLDLPVDPKTGKEMYPTGPDGIRGKEGVNGDLVADARTNFNYLHSLENGYINGIDETYKATMQMAAKQFADWGIFPAERVALGALDQSPVRAMKTAAFKLFLSSNPIRQAVIQRGQILMLGAINPKYMATGLVKDLTQLNVARTLEAAGLPIKDKRMQALLDEVKEAGLLEAVDANNLIREDFLHMADLSAGQKLKTAAGKPLEWSQQIGFDLAEQDNLLASWLAHRDLAKRRIDPATGKPVNMKNQRVKDEVLGQSRAYTLNMNRAGEMPYSQNTLGLVAQFFSFRHKAMLQGLTNKSLDAKTRAKVLAYTTVMYGVEASVLGAAYKTIWGDTPPSPMKDDIEAGLLDYVLNQGLTMASGEEQDIDFGDLAPIEAYGIGNVLQGVLTTDLTDFIASSPSGSLLFGANPRITDMFKSFARLFNLAEDYEDPALQTTFKDVAISAANLFSGYSNAMKARYALEVRQKLSSSGNITDDDVTVVEAAVALAGLQTRTETGYREVKELLYGESEFIADDVEKWYYDLKRHFARRQETTREDYDLGSMVLNEAWRVFGSDRPLAREQISQLLRREMQDGDFRMFQSILRHIGYKTNEEVWELVNAMPDGPERDRLSGMLQTKEESEADG